MRVGVRVEVEVGMGMKVMVSDGCRFRKESGSQSKNERV